MKKILCMIFAVCMLLSLVGCADNNEVMAAQDLTEKYTPQNMELTPQTDINGTLSISNFAVKVLQAQNGDNNILISPMSIMYALAMTMNGADGETLAQMENTLGFTKDDLNLYLYAYNKFLPEDTEDAKLNMANSIWMRNEDGRLSVKDNFLQTVSNFYDASIYSAPFDNTTLNDINNWVKNNTDGMIDKILNEIPDASVMYLINAIVFDAKWQTPYADTDVWEGVFKSKSGEKKIADFMWSTEYKYIENENTEGFVKDYKNGYSFVALLPNEDMPIDDYIESLTGEQLYKMLMDVKNQMMLSVVGEKVRCGLPKFNCDYKTELSETLAGMGMTDLFDCENANLNNIGSSTNGNLYVSRVLHKTHIDVDEEGTKAAAVTSVEVNDECAIIEDCKEIKLNRPFVYMLVDTTTMTPIFIGVENQIW